MYPASDAFHQAVANGNEQKVLLIFSDCVFTDEDISIDNGIDFHEYFNTEEDLSIGQATSNEISFSLFNDARLLNNYAFGDFLATLGVQIGSQSYTQSGNATVVTDYATYVANSSSPYITRNGSTLTGVSYAVSSLLAYDGKVYAFNSTGQKYAVFDDATGDNISRQITPLKPNHPMRTKVTHWIGEGICYKDRILKIWKGGVLKTYEFVPLGHFTAERPKAPDRILIDMTCYDYMQKFERDMPDAAAMNITYPADIQTLFGKMCQYLGVTFQTEQFINGDAMISSEPDEFRNATMRDVLKWIAEAAGSNARFDRDGKLVLDWIRNTEIYYTASDYMEFNPYWYKTPKVTKLYNRDTTESTELTVGEGTESYLIQDNPLLKGVS